MRRTGTTTRYGILMVLWVLGVGAGAEASGRRSVDTLPLPETAGDYGWLAAQRIRFENGRLFKYAQAAVAAGDYPVAREHLQAALEADPKSNRARLGLIQVNEKLERWDDAIAMCDAISADYPDYVEAYERKAALAEKKGDVALAIEAYQAVVAKTKPRDAHHALAQRSLAEMAFKAEDYAMAATYAKPILKRRDTLPLRLFLAECAVKQTNAVEALLQFDAALSMAETDTQRGDIQLARGFILYKQANYATARVALEDAVRLIPEKIDRAKVLRQLGDTAYRQKDYQKAAETFRIALQEAFHEDAAAAYIESLVASGQWEKALTQGEAFLDRAGTSEAFRHRALIALVQIYKHQEKPDLTYRVASEAYKGTGKDMLLLDMAYAAQAIGMEAEALRHFHDYLEIQFQAIPALAHHYMLKKARRFQESETILTRILALDNLSPEVKKEALYELAQIYRQTERATEYFATMDRLISKDSDYRFLMEYASLLYGVGRYDRALELFQQCLIRKPSAEDSFRICRDIAEVYLALEKPAQSREWLEKATAHGKPDTTWHLIMARVEYNEKDYEACVNRLLSLDVRSDFINLYIGFSFYKLRMPGLALYHLNMLDDLEKLPVDQRYNLLSNRAYLNFDQGQYDAAQQDIEHSLALQPSEDLKIVGLKTEIALGNYETARDQALELVRAGDKKLEEDVHNIAKRHPDTALRVDLLKSFDPDDRHAMVSVLKCLHEHEDSDLKMEVMFYLSEHHILLVAELLELAGLCELRNAHNPEAIDLLTAAIDLAPQQATAFYLRGIAHQRHGQNEAAEEDFLAYRDTVPHVSRRFWGDFGIVEGKLKHYGPGTEALQMAVEIYPSDIDSFEEAGYQYMKSVSNKYSKAAFSNAIAIYNDITPFMEGQDQFNYANNKDEMKREFSKMDRRLGGNVYFSKTEFDFPSPVAIPALGGALPSQSGIELNWRPPVIGYRNERWFNVFGRILSNFEHESWQLEKESYQGGIGVRWKPFRALNTVVVFEKLFKIGDNSEDNLLLRFTGTREWGEKPTEARPWQFGGRIYGDLGYFLEEKERWYYFLDARGGPSWYLRGDKFLLTLPNWFGLIRYESNDESNLLSYTQLGLGVNGRFLEPERELVTERWYVDIYLHYVWGWWWDEPVDYDETSFEGFLFGVSFVK